MNSNSTISRRRFLLAGSGAAAAGLLAGGFTMPAAGAGASAAAPERRIRLGVVGCGGRGGWIARLFQQHGGYELWSVADYFPEVANGCGEALGVPAERRFSGLSGFGRVFESGVEAVALETPPWFFPEHVAAAVAAGLHVYVAKPVGVDVPGVMAVEAAARRATAAGRVFLVDYQVPTDPHNAEVARRVRAGEIGPVQLLDSHYFSGLFADPPKTDTIESRLRSLVWVNDNDLGGGYHVNACIHAVHAAWMIAGARPVSAAGASRAGRANPHGDSHDVFSITFEFESGLVWCHRGKHLDNQTGFDVACQAQGRDGHAQLAYGGRAFLKSGAASYEGEVENLYEAGAVRNIAEFHRDVATGRCENATVAGAVDTALATILGREAARRRAKLTMADLLAENHRLDVDLRGLRA